MQTVHPAPTSRMPHLISTSPWAGRAVAWNAWLSWNNSKTWGQPIWPGVICSYCWTKSSQLGIGLVWSLDMSIQSAWIMNRISPRCQQFREIQLSQDRRKKTCNNYLYSFFNYHPSTKKSSVIDIKNIHPPPPPPRKKKKTRKLYHASRMSSSIFEASTSAKQRPWGFWPSLTDLPRAEGG